MITPVREPIARNVSLFFENLLEFHIPADSHPDLYNVEKLSDIFIKEVRHSTALTWFDVEMKAMLGIDVYRYLFPKEKGFLTIKEGNIDLLLLKIEIDKLIKEQAIAEFLNIENFHLIEENVAKNKIYAKMYQKFIQNVNLPLWYIETMCRSKYIRHFYSDGEIESVRIKWSHNSQYGYN